MPGEPILTVSHLCVHIGQNPILHEVGFEIREGETLVILGPNGAGKTVLLRTLLGLMPRHRGNIDWKPGTRIGYVPQRVPFNRDLPITVGDFFSLKKIEGESATRSLVEVGITKPEFLKKQLGYLSSGQFQRVLIAWALARKPDILIFDEPTAGVDIEGEETIQALLAKVQSERKMALILVTHDLSTVSARATRVLCIGSQSSCYGRPEEILDPKTLSSLYGKEIKFVRHTHE